MAYTLGVHRRAPNFKVWLAVLAVVVQLVAAGTTLAQSGEPGRVQILSRRVGTGRGAAYTLAGLEEGDTLYVYAAPTTGNLDPFVGLGSDRYDAVALRQAFDESVAGVVAKGRDPLEALPEIYREFLVAWDDDSGTGYDSALEYVVPADGDYQLLVTASPSRDSSGTVELLVGINAPQALSGRATPTGDVLAVLDEEALAERVSVQEITGNLGPESSEMTLELDALSASDTLYAYVERTSGDLAPVLVLWDFGEKPLRSANLSGLEPSAKLSYRLDEDAANFALRLLPFGDSTAVTSGISASFWA